MQHCKQVLFTKTRVDAHSPNLEKVQYNPLASACEMHTVNRCDTHRLGKTHTERCSTTLVLQAINSCIARSRATADNHLLVAKSPGSWISLGNEWDSQGVQPIILEKVQRSTLPFGKPKGNLKRTNIFFTGSVYCTLEPNANRHLEVEGHHALSM